LLLFRASIRGPAHAIVNFDFGGRDHRRVA
jgi:hypothetical protein